MYFVVSMLHKLVTIWKNCALFIFKFDPPPFYYSRYVPDVCVLMGLELLHLINRSFSIDDRATGYNLVTITTKHLIYRSVAGLYSETPCYALKKCSSLVLWRLKVCEASLESNHRFWCCALRRIRKPKRRWGWSRMSSKFITKNITTKVLGHSSSYTSCFACKREKWNKFFRTIIYITILLYVSCVCVRVSNQAHILLPHTKFKSFVIYICNFVTLDARKRNVIRTAMDALHAAYTSLRVTVGTTAAVFYRLSFRGATDKTTRFRSVSGEDERTVESLSRLNSRQSLLTIKIVSRHLCP